MVKTLSEEHKRKISEANKGGNNGSFKKGKISWNKGIIKKDDSRIVGFQNGSKHPNWKGGIIISHGYRAVRRANHPFSVNGYVKEHRLIMEKKMGRYLEPDEVVHHIDGDGLNNNEKNLQLFKRGKHVSHHNMGNKYSEGKAPWNKGLKNVFKHSNETIAKMKKNWINQTTIKDGK